MPNVDEQNPTHNSVLDHFRLACWARARLYRECEYNRSRNPIATAVDPLERMARAWGIDADVAQQIMAEAFREVRDDL